MAHNKTLDHYPGWRWMTFDGVYFTMLVGAVVRLPVSAAHMRRQRPRHTLSETRAKDAVTNHTNQAAQSVTAP
ncbi:hypothetical protein RSAG8_11204, partial [Rhizoctonia solani AG-8 WAC10335]